MIKMGECKQCQFAEFAGRYVIFAWRNVLVNTLLCDKHTQELIRYMHLTVIDKWTDGSALILITKDHVTPYECPECLALGGYYPYRINLGGTWLTVPFIGCNAHIKTLFAYFEELRKSEAITG